jgi:polyhydroxybutyrate depolymerase
MKIKLTQIFIIVTLFTVCLKSQDFSDKLIIDGLDREYIMHLPKNYNITIPRPLILVFHGGGSEAKAMVKFTKFNTLADEGNFIVCYPNAINKNWNDGRIGDQLPMDRDDVKFISVLIDTLIARYSVNPQRVFATGISNGGFFSIYLAYKLSDKILGVAPVCAALPENYADNFFNDHPVSLLLINGTDDPLVKYDGGTVGFKDEKERGKSISTDRTVDIWMKLNNCQNSVKIETLDDDEDDDGCTAKKYTYYTCKNGTEVAYIKVEGGGHTWPGGVQYLPKIIVGKVCKGFNATEVIWNFFKKLPTRD